MTPAHYDTVTQTVCRVCWMSHPTWRHHLGRRIAAFLFGAHVAWHVGLAAYAAHWLVTR